MLIIGIILLENEIYSFWRQADYISLIQIFYDIYHIYYMVHQDLQRYKAKIFCSKTITIICGYARSHSIMLETYIPEMIQYLLIHIC